MSRKLVYTIALACALTLCGCGCKTPECEIAADASQGVGEVTQSFASTAGVPVVVLEERHNSRVGQLQHAVTLVRLHDKYGLRDIVLEGYLKERPDINTEWFTKAVGAKTPEARARVAVQFLKQGDISAAEFMKIVYTDVTLRQAEYSEEYNVEPPDSFPHDEYLTAIAAVDRSWAEEKAEPYQSEEKFMSLSGDEKLKSAKEIKQYAEDHRIYVSPGAKRAMEQFINFFEKRIGSNKTISEAVASVNSGAAKAVAVNIGADHTHNIGQIFKNANRPYAVVKPLYTSGNLDQGDLTDSMYDRKNKGLPVFSRGLSALILEEFPKSIQKAKKPEPVLAEDWFGAEAELHGFVDTLAGGILGPPNPPGPPNGGKPPFGFSDDDFNGKWMSITLASVEYLADQDDRRGAILIPVVFKPSGHTVWVGATLKRGEEKGQETVEAIVTHALQSVQGESSTSEQAEDQSGRVQMSVTTFAVVGKDKGAVKRAVLSET